MAWFLLRVESREDFIPFVYWGRLFITDAAAYGAKSTAGFKARRSSCLRICCQDAVIGELIKGNIFQHLLRPHHIAKPLKVLSKRLFY